MSKKEDEEDESNPFNVNGIIFGLVALIFVLWLVVSTFTVWQHQSSVNIDSFSCSATEDVDKEVCRDLAQTYMVTKAIGNQSMTQIIKEMKANFG